jgi:hypothetical protein
MVEAVFTSYLLVEVPQLTTRCILLSAQSKVLMLKRGNGVKNERKMTGNLPRGKRRRRRMRNRKQKKKVSPEKREK